MNPDNTTIYVASAGTGKTTALMDELETALETTTPDKVIFTTFTNAGATEAAKRAREKFPQYAEHQFKYFRTLHSLSYRNIPYQPMLSFADYCDLGRHLGYGINAKRALSSSDGSVSNSMGRGDHLLHLDSLLRTRMCSAAEVAANQEISQFSPKEIQEFSTLYRAFRQRIGKYDFADQLETFLGTMAHWNQPITHLFVDEAQDLSGLQWAIIRGLAMGRQHTESRDDSGSTTERAHLDGGTGHSCCDSGERGTSSIRTIIAGDDKQSIYKFSGGDPEALINLEGDRRVLGTSYRLPSGLLKYAEEIAGRISSKQSYSIAAQNIGGRVESIRNTSSLDLSTGTWFFLCRNRKFLATFSFLLSKSGYLYHSDCGDSLLRPATLEAIQSWKTMQQGYDISAVEAKNLYKNFLRGVTVARGFKTALYALDDDESVSRDQLVEDYGLMTTETWDKAFAIAEIERDALLRVEAAEGLTGTPRIRISTIHAVKGQEADNVVLLPDLSYLTQKEFRKDPDNEHRVFYVGVTRARKNLYLHKPITENFYKL